MSTRRLLVLSTLLLVSLPVVGCQKRAALSVGANASAPAAGPAAQSGKTSPVSTQAASRRIIRNATLAMTVRDPAGVQHEASMIAGKLGGYVANATSHRLGNDADDPLSASLELRVPANHLDRALSELKKLADGVDSEQIESRDVTDQYVDLDARLKTQKQLEKQYLSILGNATKVSDALEVQKQLASVRTEIEKLEGTKRVLDSQIEMSTIKLELEQKKPLITASFSALSKSTHQAGADAVNFSALLVKAVVRLLGVLLPLLVVFGLPGYLMARFLLRRSRRRAEAWSATASG